jgi:hypothetical protein
MAISHQEAKRRARRLFGRTGFARKFPEPQDGKAYKVGRATIWGGVIGYIALGSGHTFAQAFAEARRRAGNLNPAAV